VPADRWLERILAVPCKEHGVGAGLWCRQPVNVPAKSYVCASRIQAAEEAERPGPRVEVVSKLRPGRTTPEPR